jgi:hypothetical protein
MGNRAEDWLKQAEGDLQPRPSKTPGPYVTFAASRFLRPDRVIVSFRETVAGLKSRHPDIEAVYLFGSHAAGVPTAGSDIDLLVVTETGRPAGRSVS